ncbi:MAG TPA: alkaline phosphatase family protein [Candidatus Acidoferrum sp.]|nr:alkaline phosphatase family protein [Candidatus Acidoferrum sp.]
MPTNRSLKTLFAALALFSPFALFAPPETFAQTTAPPKIAHVLILGIDGLHAFDLENYVRSHPRSALAQIKRTGITYLNASTSKPSDSFPGILSIVTGGSPFSTGVYYETSYDRQLSPPGSKCATKGTEIPLDESIDVNPDAIDGGGLDPHKLPLDPARNCAPVYPHDLLRVNTLFEVIHAAGLRTAWADKQPSYEIVNGPSGRGVDDLFVPELHANRSSKSLEKIEAFDDLRLQAILNEIAGKDHAGEHPAPVPAVFGMTFQAITVGQKLRAGMGYLDATGTPSAALASALDYTDKSIAKILDALRAQNLSSSTVVILTAKHGQTPVDATRVRIVDEKLIPGVLNSLGKDLVAECSGDDVLLIWLRDPAKTSDAVAALVTHQAETHISRIYSGAALRLLFPDPELDSRAPDIVVEPELGVIYTNPKSSAIAEHGSFQDLDTHVPLVLSNPNFSAHEVHTAVQTTQIAPTVLRLLNLDPNKLQAVQIEKTQLLPEF